MAVVFIGLGSNLGDRNENLSAAAAHIAGIDGIRIVKRSSILDTKPVEYLDQPDFLNQIVQAESLIAPEDLLRRLQQIEERMKRTRDISKGPRTIDLDILLFNGLIVHTDTLTIPHPGIHDRIFILRHLIELDPHLKDPVTGRKYSLILEEKTANLPSGPRSRPD